MNRRSFLAGAILAALLAGLLPQAEAQTILGPRRRAAARLLPRANTQTAVQTPAKSPQAWTLDDATEQLRLNPDDVYLQYVVLQLARAENKVAEVVRDNWNPRRWGPGAERRVDLFDLFTGALAVQESLQLDTMQGREADWLSAAVDPARNTVKVADLKGPNVRSHPWGKMLAAQTLAGKKPEVSPLSLCVPEDQYYVEFRLLSKLLDAVDVGDLWGDHLLNQAARSSTSQQASQRLKTQLAIRTDPLTRPFYDLVVNEVALTGSDLYFREGTDIAMLFEVKQPEVFRLRMDGFLDAAAKSRPDAVRSTGKAAGVDYAAVTTPDRAISAFSAYPRPNLHVRSNSKAALERVLAAIAGKQPRLGEATEFKYIRTLMVRGDQREDGFVYLSDPFIHRVVSAELKLTERRRLMCYNHLRMIGHAAMLYRTQFGKEPKSLAELAETGCAPAAFVTAPAHVGKNAIYCPCGGKYSLAADGIAGVCSHHGHARQLVPCLEIAEERVTEHEADEYRRFVAMYNSYWRTYFDPIAIRIQVSPEQYRAETIILPLIDNSIYTGLAAALGGEPEPLDAMPVPPRNIFSVVLRLNKEQLLKDEAMYRHFYRDLERMGVKRRPGAPDLKEFISKGLGNRIGLHVYDASPTFDFNLTGFLGEGVGRFGGARGRLNDDMFMASFLISSLNSPVYIAVPVKDAQIVDAFLDELDAALAAQARQRERGGWFPLDYDFYKVPLVGGDRRIRCFGVGLGPVKWRLFFARLDDGLYVASKQFILEDLAAMKARPGGDGPTAHGMVRIRAENWKAVLPEYRLGWEENARQACLNNLGPLSSVARAVSAMQGGAAKAADVHRQADELHAVHFFCPDGGRYEASADGKQVTCSIHGSAAEPRQLAAPARGSATARLMREFAGATAELTFLEDGLHAVVTVKRK